MLHVIAWQRLQQQQQTFSSFPHSNRRMISRLLIVAASIISLSTAQMRFDEMYDATIVSRFNAHIRANQSIADFHRTVISVGAIAYYARLRRAFGRTMTGERLAVGHFPKLPGALSQKLMDMCTKDIIKCIKKVEEGITDRYPALFTPEDNVTISERIFADTHMEKMNAFDTTFSYIFCFFSHNKLLPLKALPFCSIGPDETETRPLPIRISEKSVFGWDARPFQCAIESFCPDPCCNKARYRDTNRCQSICEKKERSKEGSSCMVKSEHNAFLGGMIWNQWNMSCDCAEKGFRYDYRSRQCVDIDECSEEDWSFCSAAHEVCINTVGSYKCVCKMGSRRINGICTEFALPKTNWYGLAHEAASEKSINLTIVSVLLVLLFGNI